MKRIWVQCIKELAQLQRDRLTLALAFLLPLLTFLIYGFAIRLEAKNIPLVMQDFDNSYLSRTYTDLLVATNQFNPTSWRGNDPVHNALDRGIAKVAVVIPPDFSRRIKAGKTSIVQVLVDGTDANNARVIQNTVKATTSFFLRSTGLQPSTDRVIAQKRLWFNPGRKESLYIVPGVYGLILWVYPSLLTAIAMVRDKEQGTILQAYASSLSATEFLLGKALAYLILGISEALFIMVLGSLIFRLGFAGDPTPLLIGTPVFLATSVMFGLFVGVSSSDQNAAVQNVSFIGFMTALLLSGFIYPLSNIPFPLSLLPNIVPSRYYIELTRDAFVRGTGWTGVWQGVLIVALIGLLLFIATRQKLRRMQLPD